MIEVSSLSDFSALRCPLLMDFGCLALVSIVLSSLRTESMLSESRLQMEDSTPAMTSVAEMCLGVTARLRPFFNSVVSSFVRFLLERFITQLVVSNCWFR